MFFILYFSACVDTFRLEMKPGWYFLIFRIFLHLFLNFITRVSFERIRMKCFFIFYFSACADPFHLEMKPGWYFLIFRIFLHLFLNFLTRVWFERIGKKFFLYSIFRPVLTCFILKWILDDVFLFLEFFCIYFWIL